MTGSSQVEEHAHTLKLIESGLTIVHFFIPIFSNILTTLFGCFMAIKVLSVVTVTTQISFNAPPTDGDHFSVKLSSNGSSGTSYKKTYYIV